LGIIIPLVMARNPAARPGTWKRAKRLIKKMINIQDRFLTKGAAHGRPGAPMDPKGIVVHYVGNAGSSAEANRGWFEGGSGGASASAHYIIGLNGEILRLIPDNERAWHAGRSFGPRWDAMAKTNNSRFIGIECCHPGPDGKFNEAAYNSLVELCALLCGKYGLDPVNDVYRHYDVCGKQCPLWYVSHPDGWAALKADIKKAAAGRGPAGGQNPAPGAAIPEKEFVTLRIDGAEYRVAAKLDTEAWTLFVRLGELARHVPGLKLPFRRLIEAAGYTYTFDEEKRVVTAVKAQPGV
jgi:hypothetical protein